MDYKKKFIKEILEGRDLSRNDHQALIERVIADLLSKHLPTPDQAKITSRIQDIFQEALNDIVVDGKYRVFKDIQDSLLTMKEIVRFSGMGESTVYSRIASGDLPERRRGERGWHLSDVRKMIDKFDKSKDKLVDMDDAIMNEIEG